MFAFKLKFNSGPTILGNQFKISNHEAILAFLGPGPGHHDETHLTKGFMSMKEKGRFAVATKVMISRSTLLWIGPVFWYFVGACFLLKYLSIGVVIGSCFGGGERPVISATSSSAAWTSSLSLRLALSLSA